MFGVFLTAGTKLAIYIVGGLVVLFGTLNLAHNSPATAPATQPAVVASTTFQSTPVDVLNKPHNVLHQSKENEGRADYVGTPATNAD